MRGKKIVKNYYEFIPEIPQFSKKLKVERSGFVLCSIFRVSKLFFS